MKPKHDLDLLDKTVALLKGAEQNLGLLASVKWESGELSGKFEELVAQSGRLLESLHKAREKLLIELVQIAIAIGENGEMRADCTGMYSRPQFRIVSATQMRVHLNLRNGQSDFTLAEVCRYNGLLGYRSQEENKRHTLFDDICNQIIERIGLFLAKADRQSELVQRLLGSIARLEEVRASFTA
jgi:hypothetical protein